VYNIISKFTIESNSNRKNYMKDILLLLFFLQATFIQAEVNLVSFTATAVENNVELNWTTNGEINNQGFDIERSNGSGFTKIGFLQGHGTTTEIQNYTFIDRNLDPGTYYYRLKQIDYSGAFVFSNTIDVEVTPPTQTIIWNDTDYNGFEIQQINGFGTNLVQGTIIRYDWLLNGIWVDSVEAPFIKINTGTNVVTLTVLSDLGETATDSIYVTVYCAKTQTNGGIYSGISEYNGKLFFTSIDKGVYRIDSTGTLIQSYLTGGSIQSTLCISSNTNRMYVGSSDTRLYCFDSDLNPIWDKGIGGVVNASASVTSDGNILYVGTNDNNLHIGYLKAFDASNGTAKWTFQANGEIISSPVLLEVIDSTNTILQKNIYFGTKKGMIYSITDNGSSYSTFWSLTTTPDSAIISTSAVSSNGFIYIGSRNGYLYRVRWDGLYQSDWKVNTGGPIVSSPIIDEMGNVYISSASGYVLGYPKDFIADTQPVKRFYQVDGINGSPAFGPNGSLIVGCDSGKVYSLNKNTSGVDMEVNWVLNAGSQVLAPSYISENGLLYIGTTNGDVYVVKEFVTPLGKMTLEQSEWPTFKGNNQRSKVVQLNTSATGITNDDDIPSAYSLAQNYPNPFNPNTQIKYSVPRLSQVILKIFNTLGEELETLVSEEKPVGTYEVNWNAANLPSGVYFYRLKAGDFVQTKKMILLK